MNMKSPTTSELLLELRELCLLQIKELGKVKTKLNKLSRKVNKYEQQLNSKL